MEGREGLRGRRWETESNAEPERRRKRECGRFLNGPEGWMSRRKRRRRRSSHSDCKLLYWGSVSGSMKEERMKEEEGGRVEGWQASLPPNLRQWCLCVCVGLSVCVFPPYSHVECVFLYVCMQGASVCMTVFAVCVSDPCGPLWEQHRMMGQSLLKVRSKRIIRLRELLRERWV